jgi:prepilin-type N-terminal cleavage/methylation domain-containing protein
MKKSTQQKNISLQYGFTLIEVMISVAIFTIIMTVGMGALVNITQNYSIARERKTVADNLSFMLESVTREIRLGTEYYSGSGSSPTFFQKSSRDGSASSVGFVMANPSDIRGQYMSYSLEDGVLKRYRYKPDGVPLQEDTLNDSNAVIIESIDFTVIGSTLSGTSDGRQPLVWIRMKARSLKNDTSLSLQTLVSQRALDF